MRTFDTGATRSDSDNKNDYEAFLHPLCIKAFGDYMQSHRVQPDGKLRPGDNWQKGIPKEELIKSEFRHFLAQWMIHRGETYIDEDTGEPVKMKNAICGVIFNAFAYLLEVLKHEQKPK